ncbi:acyl-CoA/acyl-ACP dehydrogenase [Gordonia sp. PP30]|uniref:acyl-CoA dehydrogenase family protein n=1 Tax=Gordonia sp. PP30 TaxID=2935861 RepID=UPI001FFFFD6D|nr:acyl-CoA dehydrogenase family protein [Gordonia sp. PP30]UQE75664.1 acyl-CoA/acyl-ACP dehydrogenase [Gordonia sp. PP30]
MDFLLDDTHSDLAETVTAIATRAGGTAVARAWADGDREPGLAVYRQLAEAGITGLLVDDGLGGSGAGAVEMTVAAERLGRWCMPGPVADTVAAVPAALDAVATRGAGAGDLAELLAGRPASCVLAPVNPRAADPGAAQPYLIRDGALFRASPAGPARSTVDLTRTVAEAAEGARIAALDDATARILNLAALATAAQSLGLAAAMLAIAADYAKARHQFGRAIGSFQAVKHHLADVAIAVEMARPLIHGAAVGMDGGAPGTADVTCDVSAAKVAASDAADLAARRALQVLGAIGYTAEHDLSLHLTKARALRGAWGPPAWHRARIAERLRGGRPR